jgi:hypothetical protein
VRTSAGKCPSFPPIPCGFAPRASPSSGPPRGPAAGDDASNVKPPGDRPEDPALFGIALTATPRGYRFDLVVPREVGPVVERALVPLLEAFRDQANP